MRKFKAILIISIIFFLGFSLCCISNAENSIEIDDDIIEQDDSVLTDINASPDSLYDALLSSKANYFNTSNDPINITKDIEGDAFILCKQKVTIDSFISGNVFVISTDLEITENAEISGSLFCLAQNLNLSGEVVNNVYCATQTFNMNTNSSIGLCLYLTAEDTKLGGEIEGDANISSNKITILDNLNINGDINYSSPEEIQIPQSAIILGNIRYSLNNPKDDVSKSNVILDFIRSTLSYAILALVLFLILYKANVKFIKNDIKLKDNLGKIILCGILTLLLTPLFCIVTLFTSFTLPISLIVAFIYIVLILVATPISIIVLSKLLSEKYKETFIKNNNILRHSIFIVILCIVYKLLELIPIVGLIITIALGLIGVGIITKNTFFKNKLEKENITE